MIEHASVNPIVERAAEQATEGRPSVAPQAANPSDAARFQAALNGEPPTAPPEAPAELETGAASPVKAAEPSPGDSILQTLQAMRSDYRNAVGKAETLAGNGDPSPQNLLQTQMDLTRVSMQVDLAAKAVGKVTQGLETLIKSQ